MIFDHRLSIHEFHQYFVMSRDVRTEYITDTACKMGWVIVDGNSVCVTPRGQEVVECSDPRLKLRLQLWDLVLALRPLGCTISTGSEGITVMNLLFDVER